MDAKAGSSSPNVPLETVQDGVTSLANQALYIWEHTSPRAWLVALGISFAVGVLSWAASIFIGGRIKKIAMRTTTTWDDVIAAGFLAFRGWLMSMVGIVVGVRSLELPDSWSDMSTRLIVGLGILQLGLCLQAMLKAKVEFWREEGNEHRNTATEALTLVGRVLIWSVVFLVVLSNFGVEVSALIAGLGVGGVAAALAVQSLLGDVFSAFSIYMDRPFDIGDFIIVGADKGTVTKIGWRTTRLDALGGQQIVFPNSSLTQSLINNYTRMERRRVILTFGVLYSTPSEVIEAIPGEVKRIIDAQEGVTFDRSHFSAFGESSLDFEAIYWVESPEYVDFMNAQQAINLAVMRCVRDKGTDFAFPTRSLHLESVPTNLRAAS